MDRCGGAVLSVRMMSFCGLMFPLWWPCCVLVWESLQEQVDIRYILSSYHLLLLLPHVRVNLHLHVNHLNGSYSTSQLIEWGPFYAPPSADCLGELEGAAPLA